MRLDRRKDIQSVKSNWSIWQAVVKTYLPLSLKGTIRKHKTNTHTELKKHLRSFLLTDINLS